jgi:hypothetical protein
MFNLEPRPFVTVMIATAMPAAIKPYSIAVAAVSSRKKRSSVARIFYSCPVKRTTCALVKQKKPSEPLARIYWWNGFAAIPDGEGHHGQSTNGSRDKVERQLVDGHIEEARAYEHDGTKNDHHQDGIHYIVLELFGHVLTLLGCLLMLPAMI